MCCKLRLNRNGRGKGQWEVIQHFTAEKKWKYLEAFAKGGGVCQRFYGYFETLWQCWTGIASLTCTVQV